MSRSNGDVGLALIFSVRSRASGLLDEVGGGGRVQAEQPGRDAGSDHGGGQVDVAAGDVRHDGSVADVEPVQAMRGPSGADHRARIADWSHLAGADRMAVADDAG